MHGRVRVRTSAEKEAAKNKEREATLTKFKKAMQVLKNYDKLSMEQVLPVSEQLLYKQPDLVLAWNIRRDNFDKINLENELDLTFCCLKENPKSYSVWFHRRLVLDEIAKTKKEIKPEEKNEEEIKPHPCYHKELQTVDWYLSLDQRNFHAWDHRRWLVKKLNRSIDDELSVTKSLIDKDFSNHSAWHYRSSLLKQKHGETLNFETVKFELDYVTNAFYVDPEDQAGWIYYDWLLSICPEELIAEQIQSLKDLNDCEPGSKYVMLKLLKIGGDKIDRKSFVEELIKIDKQRRNYYETLKI